MRLAFRRPPGAYVGSYHGIRRERCGRFRVQVTPNHGWSDPHGDWLESGTLVFSPDPDLVSLGGVAGGICTNCDPYASSFDLAEWVRFHTPGRYSVQLQYSGPKEHTQESFDRNDRSLQFTSAWLEIEVLAPEAGELAAMEREISELSAEERDQSYKWPPHVFLGHTESAIRLLATTYPNGRLKGEQGLRAAPNQKLVLMVLEESIARPDQAISADLLQLLAFVATRLEAPELFAPNTKLGRFEERQAAGSRRRTRFLLQLERYAEQAFQAAEVKAPEAALATYLGILELRIYLAPDERATFQELQRRAALALPKYRRHLKAEPFRFLLRDYIGVYDAQDIWELLHGSLPPAQTLQVLAHLAPQTAEALLERAVAERDEAVLDPALSILKPGPISELTAYFRDRLSRYDPEKWDDPLPWLINAAGAPALVPPVRKLLASSACLGPVELWAFMLRHDPRAAVDAQRRFRSAVEEGCETASFAVRLADLHWSEAVEGLLLDLVGRGDSHYGDIAARLIAGRGSSSAQASLIAYLRRSSGPPSTEGKRPFSPFLTEELLARTDDEVIAALSGGCYQNPCSDEKSARTRTTLYEITPLGVDGPWVMVWDRLRGIPLRLNELETQVKSFAPGTTFVLGAPISTALTQRLPELREILARNGFGLEFDESAYFGSVCRN